MEKLNTIDFKTYDIDEVGFDLEDALAGTTTRTSTVKYYKIEDHGRVMALTLYNKNKRKIKLRKK